jgi:hypothetical protein
MNGIIPEERLPIAGFFKYKGTINSINSIGNPNFGDVYTCLKNETILSTIPSDIDAQYNILSVEDDEYGNKILTIPNILSPYTFIFNVEFVIKGEYTTNWLNIISDKYELVEDEMRITLSNTEYNEYFKFKDIESPRFSISRAKATLSIKSGDMVLYDGITWLKINSNNNDTNRIIELEQKVNNLENLVNGLLSEK